MNQLFTNKPGYISNECLIDQSKSTQYKVRLKQNLQEMHDYITVPMNGWNYLASWYNYDFTISKELAQSITNPKECVLNLYPDDNEIDVEISRNPSFYSNIRSVR